MQPQQQATLLKVLLVLTLVAVLLGMAVWFNYKNNQASYTPNLQLKTGFYFPQAIPIKAFHLTTTDNTAFGLTQLQGKWTLMFFGSTSCKQICTDSLTALSQVYTVYLQRMMHGLTQVVFVSIDPRQDSLQNIGSYVQNFNTNFIGTTATPENIKQLTQQLYINYAREQGKPLTDSQQSSLQNLAHVYIFNPQAQLQAVLLVPADPGQTAVDFGSVVNQYMTQ